MCSKAHIDLSGLSKRPWRVVKYDKYLDALSTKSSYREQYYCLNRIFQINHDFSVQRRQKFERGEFKLLFLRYLFNVMQAIHIYTGCPGVFPPNYESLF